MIYNINKPKYWTFVISPIPERLAGLPEFIHYFNLETDGHTYDYS